MLMFFLGLTIFCLGFVAGAWFKSIMMDSSPWVVMKWNKEIMGYRPVNVGSRLFSNDKVIMCLEMNSDNIPQEGLIVE